MRIFTAPAIVLLVSLLSRTALAAEGLDTIIIDAGYDKQTRIAVVPFERGPEFDGEDSMAEIL